MMDENTLPVIYYALGALYYLLGVLAAITSVVFFLEINITVDVANLVYSLLVLGAGVLISVLVYRLQKGMEFQFRLRRKTASGIAPVFSDYLLPQFVAKYEERVSDAPDIRVSVMLIEREWLHIPPMRPYAQIAYYYGDFSEAETEMTWTPDEGLVGTAWKQGDIVWADQTDDDPLYGEPNDSPKTDAVTDIGAALVVPIYAPEDEQKRTPVGFLTVDTASDLEESRFSDEAIQEHFITSANIVGALL